MRTLEDDNSEADDEGWELDEPEDACYKNLGNHIDSLASRSKGDAPVFVVLDVDELRGKKVEEERNIGDSGAYNLSDHRPPCALELVSVQLPHGEVERDESNGLTARNKDVGNYEEQPDWLEEQF